MDLQIPPTAAAEHRGSYSSIRSAAGIWTPPHSPSTEHAHMETDIYEDVSTPHVNPIKVENMVDIVVQEPARHESPDLLEGNPQAVQAVQAGQSAQAEEQPTELRLSDFEVVDTLGNFRKY